MKLATALLALTSTASAATLVQSSATPLLKLRGGSYPAPKPGYHGLAAKGAAATKVPVVPNLLSGFMAGAYVSFGAILAISVASAMPGLTENNPGLQKLVFGVSAATRNAPLHD